MINYIPNADYIASKIVKEMYFVCFWLIKESNEFHTLTIIHFNIFNFKRSY